MHTRARTHTQYPNLSECLGC